MLTAAAQRAELALTNSAEFCRLVSQARQYRAKGWWDGSAFRRHPCGLVVDTVKLTNYWNVDDLCDIQITDGAGWDTRGVCRDSLAHGDPHPKPIEGGALQVWRCGRWADPLYEEQLRTRLLAILTAAAEHIEQAQARECAEQEAAQAAADAKRQHVTAAALAKAAGGEAC
jgi:hypothetical protein